MCVDSKKLYQTIRFLKLNFYQPKGELREITLAMLIRPGMEHSDIIHDLTIRTDAALPDRVQNRALHWVSFAKIYKKIMEMMLLPYFLPIKGKHIAALYPAGKSGKPAHDRWLQRC